MFNFYEYEGKILFSPLKLDFKPIDVPTHADKLYFLNEIGGCGRRFYNADRLSMLFDTKETLEGHLLEHDCTAEVEPIVVQLISQGKVMVVNTAFDDYKACLEQKPVQKRRVNVIGLGDVGINLIIGLRLTGHDVVSDIGVYSPDENSALRCEAEINQIYPAFCEHSLPEVSIIDESRVTDCDVLIFAASKSVPAVGSGVKDVRMVQFEGNASILKAYARAAREAQFSGLFAVVSDPVDQLCKYVYTESNTDEHGNIDKKGLSGEQVRGFGLGVMNARARYYSKRISGAQTYEQNGRAYGPHGKGLVIANDISSYDKQISEQLTELTLNANFQVRSYGYKPYLAPAFSSAALSICAYLREQPHYSSVLIDGAFLGVKNRQTPFGTCIEHANLHPDLFSEIKKSHQMLKTF